MNLKERARDLKINIPAIYIALKDYQTPLFAKIMAGIVVIYALSPIDLIPDFIPVLGYLDDIIILPFLIAITVKLIPNEVFQRAKIESENFWEDTKSKKWMYALPIIFIWMIILYFIFKILI